MKQNEYCKGCEHIEVEEKYKDDGSYCYMFMGFFPECKQHSKYNAERKKHHKKAFDAIKKKLDEQNFLMDLYKMAGINRDSSEKD